MKLKNVGVFKESFIKELKKPVKKKKKKKLRIGEYYSPAAKKLLGR